MKNTDQISENTQHKVVIGYHRVTVKHDHGKVNFLVTSTSGEEGAIEQVMAIENCPRRAIVKTKLLESENVYGHP